MEFFVPEAKKEQEEEIYEDLARFAGALVPEPGARVRRMEFVHNGEHWTAEVGEQLVGRKLDQRTREPIRESRLTDPAVVLAIFPGLPYRVVTTGRGVANVRSRWENPFMAGDPWNIEFFD